MKERVLRFYDQRQTTAQIAGRLESARAIGYASSRIGIGGGRARKLDVQAYAQLTAEVVAQPDMTLALLRAWCKLQLNILISIGALFNTLRRLKLTLKKIADRQRTIAA